MHFQPQSAFALVNGSLETLPLPDPADRLGDTDLFWGRHEELCTPAYWAAQSWAWELSHPNHYRLGRSLEEEVLACLLGGHGIPAEIGLAANRRLRDRLREAPGDLLDESLVKELLSLPLQVNGREARYRFAGQKARYIAASFAALGTLDLSADDRSFRDALTSLPGIGPKTASWIIRNWRASDEVAILDIHILRAGRDLGIFPTSLKVERHYRDLEVRFLDFAAQIGARASILDSVMWMTMRQLPPGIFVSKSKIAVQSSALGPHRLAGKADQPQLVYP
jgi:N-glycosylase/DNA lyase